jgi:uncharacterized protein DUF5317
VLGLAAPVVCALALGIVRGGSFDLRVRWFPLALVALAVQIPLYTAPLGDWLPLIGPLTTIATTALILLVVLRNATGRTRLASLIAASGVALNLLVISVNGGFMPRAEALAPRAISHPDGAFSNTAPADSGTRLAWLGDTLAQPAWLPMANLVSPGDVLLSLGAAAWVLAATRRRRATG